MITVDAQLQAVQPQLLLMRQRMRLTVEIDERRLGHVHLQANGVELLCKRLVGGQHAVDLPDDVNVIHEREQVGKWRVDGRQCLANVQAEQ